MGLFSSDEGDYSDAEKHIPKDAADTVKPKYVDSVLDLLESDEMVYHVIRGRQAGIGNTAKDSESLSTSTRAENVTTAFTDRRVLIKVPHMMSDDQYIIRNENIQGSELHSEGVLAHRSVTIHTSGKSYFVCPMGTMDEDNLQDTIEFIDEQTATQKESTTSQTAKERLEDLTELYKDGIISESEYNKKRKEILDEM
jgi:hypothetical protein